MAKVMTEAAVKNGFASAVFFSIKEEVDAQGNITIAPDQYVFHTGKIIARKVLHIKTDFTVATEGTFTAALETTNFGMNSKEWLNIYAPMHYNAGVDTGASAVEMEQLTDEWGAQTEAGAAANVPNDKMMLGLFFGGVQEGTQSGGVGTHLVQVALCSIDNATKNVSFASGTYSRRNVSLIGHYPPNDVSITVEAINDALTNNNIGATLTGFINVVSDTAVASTDIVLPKGLQVDENYMELQYA